MKQQSRMKDPSKLEVTNRPNAQDEYPVSINLLKSLTRFCIVILQHHVLPRLTFFQSSGGGQNNIIMSEKSQKIQSYVRISNKLAKACQHLLL